MPKYFFVCIFFCLYFLVCGFDESGISSTVRFGVRSGFGSGVGIFV